MCYLHHADPAHSWPKAYAAAREWVNSNFPSLMIELVSMSCRGLAGVSAFRAGS